MIAHTAGKDTKNAEMIQKLPDEIWIYENINS